MLTTEKGIAMPQTKIRRYLRHGMLPQLAVFEAVVRLGSFTRAAEERSEEHTSELQSR